MLLRHIFNSFRWAFLLLAALFFATGFSLTPLWARVLLLSISGLFLLIGVLVSWWYLRQNRSTVDPSLHIETWDIVDDAMHNSNTDLIRWGDYFYLVHAVSPYHFASTTCYLKLSRSRDGRSWEHLADIRSPDEDIRDPKLALIGGTLFLYALSTSPSIPSLIPLCIQSPWMAVPPGRRSKKLSTKAGCFGNPRPTTKRPGTRQHTGTNMANPPSFPP